MEVYCHMHKLTYLFLATTIVFFLATGAFGYLYFNGDTSALSSKQRTEYLSMANTFDSEANDYDERALKTLASSMLNELHADINNWDDLFNYYKTLASENRQLALKYRQLAAR